ncbi:MAG TPA: leishmanolysin-related zinc metalloendopeptidase, partial [Isosphaeraceae bacterium]
QKLTPDDFSDQGLGWEDLGGPYTISGTTLVVRLTDAANAQVIADAIRIERLPGQPPTIGSLTDSPDPVTQGGSLTLTANSVTDPDGSVASVAFYRESNGTAGLQTGTGGDTLVGVDTSSAGGWTVTISTSGLAAGTYTYYALATDNQGLTGVTGTAAPSTTNTVQVPASQYQIQVRFTDASLTANQRAVFTSAAARWSQIIIGDVPDVSTSQGFVDDLLIDASAPFIDGPGGILGQAGPQELRRGSFLPSYGIMQFDSADVAALESSGQFVDDILHEMGHVLGIGTIWDLKGLLSGAGGADPRFLGAAATAQYNAIFGTSASSVPVENTGGSGTRDSHWRESVFVNELMTGYLNSGVNPLSRITVASLADLGYTVNLNAADPYTPPGRLLAPPDVSFPAVVLEPSPSPALRAPVASWPAARSGAAAGAHADRWRGLDPRALDELAVGVLSGAVPPGIEPGSGPLSPLDALGARARRRPGSRWSGAILS